MFPLIKTLTELSGPVGQEGTVLDAIETLWRERGAAIERTRIGNIVARAGGSGPKVALVAHADELCYLVRAIDPDGFLYLANGQGWRRTISLRDTFTLGQRVRILSRSGVIPGVISTVTGHLATMALPEPSEFTWNDFWVDTGLSREELMARGVTPGTRLIWEASTEQFGNHVVGKALDDRVPLAVLTEVLTRVTADQLNCQLTLICTVQEEVGTIGAAAMALAGKREWWWTLRRHPAGCRQQPGSARQEGQRPAVCTGGTEDDTVRSPRGRARGLLVRTAGPAIRKASGECLSSCGERGSEGLREGEANQPHALRGGSGLRSAADRAEGRGVEARLKPKLRTLDGGA